MLDIRINGESADLVSATTLTLERFNPLFDFAEIQGSRVFGFDLPNTPTNRRLFGYFDQAPIGYTNRKYRCEKYLFSQLIEEGFVMIQKAKDDMFSLYYTQDLGEIFGDSQKLPLSQLNLGVDAIAPVAGANHLTDRYCFPTIENNQFYGNQAVDGFTGLVNQYNSGAYLPTARVPMPFLRSVFSQFGQLTGWSFVGSFWQDPDLARLILYNLFSLDGLNSINANNHLPGLTLPQLVMDLRRLFNLYIEFDIRRNICRMDFSDDVLASNEVVDWTDKAQPEHDKVPELANRLELGYELDSNDGLLKPVPADLDIYTTVETTLNEGGTVVPIKSRLSTLLTNPATGLAMTQQPGISPNNKDNKNDSTPKLLFWNGLINGVPTATNAQGARRLAWHGPNNLVDAEYRLFEAFKGDTFSLTKMVNLTPSDMAQFSFRRKVHIKGVNYLIGSMKASLSVSRKIIPAEVVLWRA